MSIVCPNCGATSHDANAAARSRSGRLVHCAGRACSWHAAGSAVLPASAMRAAEVIRPPTASAPCDGAVALRQAPDRDAAVERFGSRSPVQSRHGFWPEPNLSIPLLRSPPLAPDIIDATAAMPLRAQPKFKNAPRRGLDSARKDARTRFLPGLVVLQLAAVAAILLGRAEVVRVLPETASLFRMIGLSVNLRGLVVCRRENTHGAAGRRRRADRGRQDRERFGFRGHGAAAANSRCTTPPEPNSMLGPSLVDAATLVPGESLSFQARMASPPSGGNDVLVRFAHPSDG